MSFLRRSLEKMRRHDWSGVIVDLIVVVLGVFIGLQAANWNEDRIAAQRGAQLTQRLLADLRIKAWNTEMQIGYHTQVQANAMRAVNALAGRADLSDEELLVATYRATQYNDNTHQRATYDELISTGEVDLIADTGLRTLAMQIYTLPVYEQFTQDGRGSQVRQWFRKTIPLHVQTALARDCGDHIIKTGDFAGIATAIDYPCRLDLPSDEIVASARLLRGDTEVLGLLQLRATDIGTNISNLVFYLPEQRQQLLHIVGEAR